MATPTARVVAAALLLALARTAAAQDFAAERRRMVEDISALVRETRAEIGKRAFDERVMTVMGRVPRHAFVPAGQVAYAYQNRPLPIGPGQAISQPYIVALMTDLARVEGRILEIAMTDAPVRTAWHIWLIGIIAVLFNFIGVFDFVMTMTQGAKYQASAGMTPDQIAHYQMMPSWMTVVWAVGVFTAFLASILLLLRRKLALPVFVLSLAAFLGSLLYTYVLTDGGAIMGQQMAITSVGIAGLLVFFIWYSRFMTARGALR